MDHSRKLVKKNLKAGKWRVCSVRAKDKPRYKSSTYQVFHLVYDNEKKIVRNFFVCSVCRLLINTNLSKAGNSKLTRHDCYQKYILKKREETPSEDDVEEDESDNDNEDTFISEQSAGSSAPLGGEDEDNDDENNDFVASSTPIVNKSGSPNSSDDEGDDHDTLVKAFSGFSIVCARGGIFSNNEVEQILPRPLTTQNL